MKNDWLEDSLDAWGRWRGTIALAQGWGGAGNAMDGAGWKKASPGVYSNPVLAEYIRSMMLHHGDSALIDRLVKEVQPKDRQVMFLRYVGEKVAVTTKTIISIGSVQVSGEPGRAGAPMSRASMQLTMEVPLHTDYSGKLPYIRIAELAEISEDAAARIVARVKKELRFTIQAMAKVRKGVIGEARRAA